jgi:hypothetical protein
MSDSQAECGFDSRHPLHTRKTLPQLGIDELHFSTSRRSGPFQNPVNDPWAICGPQRTADSLPACASR